MQHATHVVDSTQQFYYATIPHQTSSTAPSAVTYPPYGGGYYQDPYMIAATAAPNQPSQPMMMPVGHSGFIYMPQPSAPMYYATGPQPLYYSQEMYIPSQITVPQSVIPSQSTIGQDGILFDIHNLNMDPDDVLVNLSKISTVSECNDSDTVCGEREKENGPRLTRERRISNVIPFNYKTRLCMTYSSGKECEMGDRCKFAHGTEDLRALELTPRAPNVKYKTKLCKNFLPFASGFCPYGLRCEFIHPTDKEYSTVVGVNMQQSQPRQSRPSALPNMCDVTPETMIEGSVPTVTRSAMKAAPEKIILKNRNVAGSMMCLASVCKKDTVSDDSAIGSGSSESGGSLSSSKMARYFGAKEFGTSCQLTNLILHRLFDLPHSIFLLL
uniref:C3H1-type domain-containing protein n=1 Tax=Heterorhabditis bacteriophora TaxID=37862 RepID=A0A1I7XHK8_HETBA